MARILLVDDDPLVRFLICSHLTEGGFEVIEAESGDSALPLLEMGADLAGLVTDVQMPGDLNGFDLAQIARERWPTLPIVVVSGFAPPGLGGLPVGAAFLAKPFSPEELLRCLPPVPGAAGH